MKSKTTAALLAIFLGGIGVHQFYLGRGGKGIMYLLFCWTFIPAIIAFIDAITLLTMSEAAFNLKYNYIGFGMPANQVVNHVHVGNNSNHTGSAADELVKLSELREKGIISEEEFNLQKQRILS